MFIIYFTPYRFIAENIIWDQYQYPLMGRIFYCAKATHHPVSF